MANNAEHSLNIPVVYGITHKEEPCTTYGIKIPTATTTTAPSIQAITSAAYTVTTIYDEECNEIVN